MAYRFKLDESFEKGFRRIAREQIDRALSELSSLEVGPASVHESRKAIKRLRALVRLAAPAIGEKAAARRNASLRKIAHMLATRRDEAVLYETMAKFDLTLGTGAKEALAHLRGHPTARASDPPRPLEAEAAQQARLLLVKEAKRFARIKFKARGFDAVSHGLDASYRSGRRALKAAYHKPSDEAFHELRKTVQTHWRQMSLLSRAWPETFEARVSAAREISQFLGDDHDLAILHQAAKSAVGLPQASLDAIERACRAQQGRLRSSAEFRIARLFAEAPGAFCRRIERYWLAGRQIRPLVAPKVDPLSLVPIAAAPVETPNAIASKAPAVAPSQRRA
ncbi:MAG: CHAD domain-containing protein [Hyphomicrobium sp.]